MKALLLATFLLTAAAHGKPYRRIMISPNIPVAQCIKAIITRRLCRAGGMLSAATLKMRATTKSASAAITFRPFGAAASVASGA